MLKKLITTSVIALIFTFSSLSALAVDGEIYTGESPDGITAYDLNWDEIQGGDVSFTAGSSEFYRVELYKDGEKVGRGTTVGDNGAAYVGDLMTESGTYEFIVFATNPPSTDISSGSVAKSEAFEFVAPSETLGTASNLDFRIEDNKTFCTWDAPENWVEGRDFFEVYIVNDTTGRGILSISIETTEEEIPLEYFGAISEYGYAAGGVGTDGVYYFSVKAVSGDITKIASSDIEVNSTVSYSHPDGTISPLDGETPPPVEPEEPDEKPQEIVSALSTASKVLVNGDQIAFDAYNINGNNYFKLRDLAFVLVDVEQSFDIEWDAENNAINIIRGTAYTPVGGELSAASGMTKTGTLTNSKVFIDNEPVSFTAYNIDGNNYFKLRDVCEALYIGVTWDAETSTIGIDTSIPYTD